MGRILFTLSIIFVFLTIFIESIILILQLYGRKITRWFGDNAFNFHMIVTISLWVITFFLIILLQFSHHPQFHNSITVRFIGLFLFISGSILGFWGFYLLGLKRALCLNFFEQDVPIVKKSLYRYLDNPLDFGLWLALLGFALLTNSAYNLVITVEFIMTMIPHILLENINLSPL
jgi:protein-S-isoprenylcysteine O-methyltransferase Ste14